MIPRFSRKIGKSFNKETDVDEEYLDGCIDEGIDQNDYDHTQSNPLCNTAAAIR